MVKLIVCYPMVYGFIITIVHMSCTCFDFGLLVVNLSEIMFIIFDSTVVTSGKVAEGNSFVNLNQIKEDSGWLNHIKSVFATLQATPSVTRSHRLSGGQGEQLTHSAVSCTGDIISTSSNVIDHNIDSSRMIGTGCQSSTIN